jgi:tetratricopeptide (TPR) repeat protein
VVGDKKTEDPGPIDETENEYDRIASYYLGAGPRSSPRESGGTESDHEGTESGNVAADSTNEQNDKPTVQWTDRAVHFLHLGQYEDALKAAEEATKANPDDGYAWRLKAEILLKLNSEIESSHPSRVSETARVQQEPVLQEAADALARAVEVAPQDLAILQLAGATLVRLQRREEALRVFDDILRSRPYDLVAKRQRALLLTELGRLNDAISCYKDLLEAEPRDVVAWQNLAVCLHATGELTQARACLRQAAGITPRSAQLQQQLGILLDEAEDPAGATDAFRRSLSLIENEVSSSETVEAVACRLLAESLMKVGSYLEAEFLFRRALRITNDGRTIVNLAHVLVKQNRLQEASDVLRDCIQTEPNNTRSLIALAAIEAMRAERLHDEFHHLETVQLLSEALDAGVTEQLKPHVYFARGCSYVALKQFHRAQIDFKRAASNSIHGSTLQVESRNNIERIKRLSVSVVAPLSRFAQMISVTLILSVIGYASYLFWVHRISEPYFVGSLGFGVAFTLFSIYLSRPLNIRRQPEVAEAVSLVQASQLDMFVPLGYGERRPIGLGVDTSPVAMMTSYPAEELTPALEESQARDTLAE